MTDATDATDATDRTDEPAASDEPAAASAPARRSRTLVVSLAVLAGVFFVGAVVMAIVASQLSGQLRDERDNRRAIESVSSTFATRLLTYDYRNLQQAKARVLALSTGKFRKEYEQAFTGGLDELLKATNASSSATVTDVFTASVEHDAASAIVVVNATAQGKTSKRRSVDSYIQLDLVRVGGHWRVDGVTNLNFGEAPGASPLPGAGAGGATSSTTPSAPTTTAP